MGCRTARSFDTTVPGQIRPHLLQLIVRTSKRKSAIDKATLRMLCLSPGKQWQLRSELYAFTQTETLSQNIDDLEDERNQSKQSTSTISNDRLLEQIKQLAYSSTREEALVNNLNYPDLVELTQTNAKPKTRLKQL